jgi:hypothetical protein
MTPPTPYQVHLRAPSGQERTLHLYGHSQAHAVASAIELAGLGPLAVVVRCCRLGEW